MGNTDSDDTLKYSEREVNDLLEKQAQNSRMGVLETRQDDFQTKFISYMAEMTRIEQASLGRKEFFLWIALIGATIAGTVGATAYFNGQAVEQIKMIVGGS